MRPLYIDGDQCKEDVHDECSLTRLACDADSLRSTANRACYNHLLDPPPDRERCDRVEADAAHLWQRLLKAAGRAVDRTREGIRAPLSQTFTITAFDAFLVCSAIGSCHYRENESSERIIERLRAAEQAAITLRGRLMTAWSERFDSTGERQRECEAIVDRVQAQLRREAN